MKVADHLTQETDNLMSNAIEYHTGSRRQSIERSLKTSLQDLSARTSMLSDVSEHEHEIRMCRNAVLGLKKSVTAHHFEDEHESPLLDESDQIQNIAAEALRLKQAYQRLKHCQFPAR